MNLNMDWILPEGGWRVNKLIQVKSDLPQILRYDLFSYKLFLSKEKIRIFGCFSISLYIELFFLKRSIQSK